MSDEKIYGVIHNAITGETVTKEITAEELAELGNVEQAPPPQ